MSTTDDFIDDDVFEMLEEPTSKNPNSKSKVSPTGYRGYQPPDEVINLCRTNVLDDVDVPIHKASHNKFESECNCMIFGLSDYFAWR